MSLYSHIDTDNAEELLLDRQLVTPKKVEKDADWTLDILQEHLQWAVDIELYTIPFYMAAMYSIKNQASEARRLLRSVANQEMLHMQCAANIANAYGTNLCIRAPSYGKKIPHLDFSLDESNPTNIYSPYSTAIGPFDVERLNTMCIIEYPDWDGCTSDTPSDEYGSIGDFYKSVLRGADLLKENILPNHQQVGHFASLYPDVPSLTITEKNEAGFEQVNTLINLILDQGEGQDIAREYVNREFQNRVDDLQPTWDHYKKFTYLREQSLPETFSIDFGNDRTQELQRILLTHFGNFLIVMNQVFSGKEAPEFAPVMYKLGAAIAACWENGTLPVFSKTGTSNHHKSDNTQLVGE